MKKSSRVGPTLLAVSLLFVAVGCKGLEAKLEGKYKGEMKMGSSQAGGKNGEVARQMAGMLANSLSLELKKDKTFTMQMLFPLEGSWSLDGTTLMLTPTKFMGMSVSDMAKTGSNANNRQQPMKFAVSDGGDTLTSVNDKPGDDTSLVFKKDKS